MPDRPGRLNGKVVLVVGAGSAGQGWGNGKAASVLFAREGATVVAVDRNKSAAEETTNLISGEGGTGIAVEADVTDPADVQRAVGVCVETFGRVDVLHNNVGIVQMGGPEELTLGQWQHVFDVNVNTAFLTCKYVLPHMVAGGGGSIVNVSSVSSIRWQGLAYASYMSSKGAVNQLSQAIAMEYAASGVRCNTVVPGLIDTPMASGLSSGYGDIDEEAMKAARAAQSPMKRIGNAWDVAYASLYLASDEAKYVTAHNLVVDGGLTASCA